MQNRPRLIKNNQAFYALILWVMLFFIVNFCLLAAAAIGHTFKWLGYVVCGEALTVLWYLFRSGRAPKNS